MFKQDVACPPTKISEEQAFSELCTQFGLDLEVVASEDRAEKNDEGFIIRLAFANGNLKGIISNCIGQLNYLKELYLCRNKIAGTIPDTIGLLANLISLDLDDNQLSGPLPQSICQLSNLTTLSLRNNQLSGPIPQTIGNLSNLTQLLLRNNQLSGPIPTSIGELVNLTTLSLWGNQLSGEIPDSIGQLVNLRELSLFKNQFSSVPKKISKLRKLTELNLQPNQLSEKPLPLPDHLIKIFCTPEYGLWSDKYPLHFDCLIGELTPTGGISRSLDQLDEYGWSPIKYAIFNDNIATIQELIAAGANYSRLEEGLERRLISTVADVQKVLATKGNVNELDKNGRTFLSIAAEAGSVELVRQLLMIEADVNLRDNTNLTAIHWAAANNHEAVVMQLIECGKYLDEYSLSVAVYCFAKAISQLRLKSVKFFLQRGFKWKEAIKVLNNDDMKKFTEGCGNSEDGLIEILNFGLNYDTDILSIADLLLAEAIRNRRYNSIEYYVKNGIKWKEACKKLDDFQLMSFRRDCARYDDALNQIIDIGLKYDSDILAEVNLYLAEGIRNCKYDSIEYYLKSGVKWKDAVSTLDEAELREFVRDTGRNDDALNQMLKCAIQFDGDLLILADSLFAEAIRHCQYNSIEFYLKNSRKWKDAIDQLDELEREQFIKSCGWYEESLIQILDFGLKLDAAILELAEHFLAQAIRNCFYNCIEYYLRNDFKWMNAVKHLDEDEFRSFVQYCGSNEIGLNKMLDCGLEIDQDILGLATTLLAEAVRNCQYGSIEYYLLNGVSWQEAVSKLEEGELKTFAESCSTDEILLRRMLDSNIRFEDMLTLSIRYLAEAIRACRLNDISYYTRLGVKWKEAIKLLSDEDMKLFATECVISDYEVVSAQGCAIWATITSIPDAKDIIRFYLERFPLLVYAVDDRKRLIVNFADPVIADIIRSMTLWHGRYQLLETRPEHKSATCYVFKATDEMYKDPNTGEKLNTRVALKFMVKKKQFVRECSARKFGFDDNYVINIIATHLPTYCNDVESCPDEVQLIAVSTSYSQVALNKKEAESMFCLAMPLGDRNLFVAIKQERFAGVNMSEVKHVFTQLMECVGHMHSQGVLHADIKPLNVVRVAGRWKLIDLDASCVIEEEAVGIKSSTAYMPPEAFFMYEDPVSGRKSVEILCEATNLRLEIDLPLLIAHPSFDMWSLGCILYQLCCATMLFQGNLDDNLSDNVNDNDSLWDLYRWTDDLKSAKLSKITDTMARNLVSRMLSKDPNKRPSQSQLMAHPFLSGKEVARLVSEEPVYDLFLSYRVDSDSHHVEILYNLLTLKGYKVYWDKICLKPGVDWERGFCEGLVNSRVFVPLLSKNAINHPDKDWQNFSKLTTTSRCDNVYLEHRLAIELQGMDMIEKVFPIFIGDYDSSTQLYSNYFDSKCHPYLPDLYVTAVEEKLCHHLDSQALGTPIEPKRTLKSVLNAITSCQGAFIVGAKDKAFQETARKIADMIEEMKIERKAALDNVPTKLHEEETSLEERLRVLKQEPMAKDSIIAEKESLSAIKAKQLSVRLQDSVRTDSLTFRADCPGMKVPIRAGPAHTNSIIGYVRHGQVIRIHNGIDKGYLELINGNGWVCTSFSNVKWVRVLDDDITAIKLNEMSRSADTSNDGKAPIVNPLLHSSTFRPGKPLASRRNSVDSKTTVLRTIADT